MRISDWSSDVCSSDLIQADDGCFGRPAAMEGGQCNGASRRDACLQSAVYVTASCTPVQIPGHGRGPNNSPGHVFFPARSEEHTSELQSLMRISYAVFCLKKKTKANKPKIFTTTIH